MKYLFFILLAGFHLSILAQNQNVQSDKIDIQKYDFKIKIDPREDSFKGKADIKVLALKDLSFFFLDLDQKKNSGKGMEVTKVMANEEPIEFEQKSDKIFIHFPAQKGEIVNLTINYQGFPADGLIISKNKYGQKSFFGDNWPNRAHYWLPVIDHPSDKALVSFEVTAPENMDVVASGKFVSRTRKDKNIIWKYQTSTAIPTKVMVFGATGFHIKNYEIYHNIPISGWIYKDSPIKGLDDYKVSVEAVKFYDSLIGPYSFMKLANVQSKTRFGGMENAGNIFYHENSVNGHAQVENLVAHEVAHQWFGNSVTEKNWKDIWLSEGFATYLTDLFLEHKYGKEKLKKRMIMERKKIIRYNSINRPAIVYEEKENLMRLLTPNSYEKGAWVLHMLRQKTGDDKFFNILRTFYKKYQNKNASTEDFIKISEEIYGKKLKDFFNQWLYKSGIPELKIEEKQIKNKLEIKITQQSSIYNLELPVLIKSGAKKKIVKLTINKPIQSFEIPIKHFQDLQTIYDPDVQVLYKISNL
jgi:aminopeptidase N